MLPIRLGIIPPTKSSHHDGFLGRTRKGSFPGGPRLRVLRQRILGLIARLTPYVEEVNSKINTLQMQKPPELILSILSNSSCHYDTMSSPRKGQWNASGANKIPPSGVTIPCLSPVIPSPRLA